MSQVVEKGERHPVDTPMAPGPSLVFGLQHVLSMYAGVVAVPLIIGGALKLEPGDQFYLVSASLFMAGIATLIQTIGFWKIGARQPIVQGTSFVAVSSMLAIAGAHQGHEGLRIIYGALIVSGILGFLIAPIFTQLLRFFPEVVTGTVITMIGLSLIPVGVGWITGNNVDAPTYGDPKNFLLAIITILIIVLIYRFLPGFFGRIAIVLGLVLGTIVAIPMGMTNFSQIGEAKAFQVPSPFYFGAPEFNTSAIVSLTICMLVIMVEATADILALGEVTEKPADRDTVTNGLRADTGSTALAGVFNGFSLSAFAQNVGLVAITGIRSRYVVAYGGAILVVLGLLPKLGGVVAAVPSPVLGGAGLVLFGTVAASGIRTLKEVDFSGNANIVIVAASLAFGMLPVVRPKAYHQFPDWFQTIFDSGITSAALVAILLNILFNIVGRKDAEGPVFSHGPGIGVISEEDEERLYRPLGGHGHGHDHLTKPHGVNEGRAEQV